MPKAPLMREKSSLVKGSWTPEEDEKLIAYISRYGIWNWTEMPKHAGLSRSGKSCRLRWMNYLKPGVRRGNITKEEEETIISLHNLLGNKWSAIATRFPGRTDNEIKNYWYTYLKKRLKKEPESTTFDAETKEMNSPGGKGNGLISDADVGNGIGLVSPATSFSDSPSPVENFDDVRRIEAIFTEGTIQGFHCFWTEPFVLDSEDGMEEAEYGELFPEPQLFFDHEYI